MKKLLYLIIFVALGLIVSCERETENAQIAPTTSKVNVTGQWEVMAHNDSIAIFGPFTVLTINDASAENDSITIQDSGDKFWNFQAKAAVNQEMGTFQTNLSNCGAGEEGIGIKISNGRIVDADSIYFEIQFEDDETPYGNTYRLKGQRISG